MVFWLLKTEPSEYAYDDLERAGRDVWDGVRNPVAQRNLRRMQPGDQAFIYHTGEERAIVGVAEIVSHAYPDPAGDGDRYVVVDVRPIGRLARPVTLRQIKANPALRDWELVRQPRLSVVPVREEYWRLVHELAAGNPGAGPPSG